MGRRKPQSDEDGGLDSLLDTMTNVVGILVLVLIVTQLSVKSVVDTAIENRVDQKEMDEAVHDLAEMKLEELELERILIAPEDIDVDAQREELERNRALLAKLKADAEKAQQEKNQYALKIKDEEKKAMANRKEIEDAKSKRAELEKLVTTSIEKKASLEAMLSKTKRRTAPADIKVSIPNPRPAPEGARQIPILCVENRVYPINVDVFRKRAELRAKAILERFRIVKDPVKGYDAAKFKRHWNQLRDQDPLFNVEYYIVNDRNLRIRFKHKAGSGGTDRQLVNSRSKIRTQYLNSFDGSKYYARFYVLPDSYDVYLTARRLFNQNRILSGWDPQNEGYEFTTWVGGVELGPPIERKPGAPRKPQNLID